MSENFSFDSMMIFNYENVYTNKKNEINKLSASFQKSDFVLKITQIEWNVS